MLKLLESTITFKGDEAKSFLKERNNGLELLQEYLEDPKMKPEYLSNIQFILLKKIIEKLSINSMDFHQSSWPSDPDIMSRTK